MNAPRRGRPPRQAVERPEMRAETAPEVRTEVRPEVREDPRDAAARRAAQIREARGGSMDEGTDRFFIENKAVPEGWDYQWKRKTVLGASDPAYEVSVARAGFTPVPAHRHPEMMPEGNYKTIERDGMILMERPKEITDEAKALELRKARQQVRVKEEQLNQAPAGHFERANKDAALAKIGKHYEPIPIE